MVIVNEPKRSILIYMCFYSDSINYEYDRLDSTFHHADDALIK